MYQDDRFIPCDLPPCDCLPDRDYPENPDWLWFFEQINDALSEVENIDQVIAQVNSNKEAIKILQDNQYRLPTAASAILGGVKADPVTPEDKQPVHIDAAGKLWTAEGGGGKGEVESVNGKKGVVHLTAEDVGALPDDTPIPPAYNLPTASGAILGGVKADVAHSDDTQPVRIRNGKLYTKPGTGGGSGGDNEVSVQLSTEPVPPEAEIVVFTDEQPESAKKYELLTRQTLTASEAANSRIEFTIPRCHKVAITLLSPKNISTNIYGEASINASTNPAGYINGILLLYRSGTSATASRFIFELENGIWGGQFMNAPFGGVGTTFCFGESNRIVTEDTTPFADKVALSSYSGKFIENTIIEIWGVKA